MYDRLDSIILIQILILFLCIIFWIITQSIIPEMLTIFTIIILISTVACMNAR